jgi:RNA polymerase sigma-70 factor (ECF subfamily)
VTRIDQRRTLAELTASLPERQRVAVLLRHLCDVPSAEIAEVLGCPEGTVRSYVSRGLDKLRRLLVERYPALVADNAFGWEEELSGHNRG